MIRQGSARALIAAAGGRTTKGAVPFRPVTSRSAAISKVAFFCALFSLNFQFGSLAINNRKKANGSPVLLLTDGPALDPRGTFSMTFPS